MSMPSNTNPKLAKMQKTASRKTTIAQRGTVFHALDCESSRDFNRIMPFPKDDTTRLDCALNSVPANSSFGYRSAAKVLYLRSAPVTSEEEIHGNAYDMVAHLMYQSSDGKVAGVAFS